MKKIYRLLYQSVRPGGTVTVIIKDVTEKGERVWLSNWAWRQLLLAGFEAHYWFKRFVRGTAFQEMRRRRGLAAVDDEDMIIVRKPE